VRLEKSSLIVLHSSQPMYWCIALLAKALLDATKDFVADVSVVDNTSISKTILWHKV
jgi:hypothetical protein